MHLSFADRSSPVAFLNLEQQTEHAAAADASDKEHAGMRQLSSLPSSSTQPKQMSEVPLARMTLRSPFAYHNSSSRY